MADTIPKSPLERFPDYVQAIGMITIEMCNLEAALCHLLDAILRTDEGTAGSLFFSPKTTAGRLDMLKNISGRNLQPKDSQRVRGLVKRAEKLLRKRNDVVHEIWGVSRDRTKVMRIPLPYDEPKTVDLKDLTRDIVDLRILSNDVDTLTKALRSRPHYAVNVGYGIGSD